MRVLVTGGAGFIGSALCRHLLELGDVVLNIDKLTYAANPASVAALEGREGYAFLRADVCDSALMHEAITAFRPDAVVHLAAESHVDRSIDAAAPFIQTNIVGTYTLLEVIGEYWRALSVSKRKTFRFLMVSTDEVYGSLGEWGSFSETAPYNPSSPYAASKASADHLAMAWHRTYGLPVIITNCSNNYGPRQYPEKLIPLMTIKALHGEPLPLYGDGRNVRDWLHVEDHARALRLVLHRGRPGERYNISGSCERTNLQVVKAICAIMDELHPAGRPHERLIRFVEDRPGHDFRYALDAGKIRRELGWTPVVTFEEGLRRTVQWYLDNEDWWRPLHEANAGGVRRGVLASVSGGGA